MPPKNPKKSAGKGSKSSGEAQQSQIEFGLPPALTTALQSITSRSTQDLWKSNLGLEGDGTAEQRAQRRANVMRVLSKRISGNMKAKVELAEALSLWLIQIAGHMQGLVHRVRAIGSKLDEDLVAAIQELGVSQEAQASLATSDQIAQATAALGAIWQPPQENEVLRVAAIIRAVGTVPMQSGAAGNVSTLPDTSTSFLTAQPGGSSSSAPLLGELSALGSEPVDVDSRPLLRSGHADGGSELSFGGHPPRDHAAAGDVGFARPSRWKKRGGVAVDRPSRAHAGTPWTRHHGQGLLPA